MAFVYDREPIASKDTHICDRQINRILPNSLYLTFNAPKVDDFHRGLFLTYPPSPSGPHPVTSGTLFHATYIDPGRWVLERRSVKDISTSASLVLLYHVGTIDPNIHKPETQFHKINAVLATIPMGKKEREKALGETKHGNPVLGGYDCVIWTGDAMRALCKAGLIDLGGRDADAVMATARALAGPEDARTMVGKDFGGLTVV